MKPQITVLVAARKNSKYLAKFLFGYLENTADLFNTEILVMLNEEDTWNKELVDYLEFNEDIQFRRENYGYGRPGLHIYFNDLLKDAEGDWVVYFCDDHFINLKGWDEYVRQIIGGGSRALKGEGVGQPLNPQKPYCIVPKFDNVGAMNQILSKGYVEAMGQIARHGNLDSYINDVNRAVFGSRLDAGKYLPGDHLILMDDAIAHDFTHDRPNPLDDINTKTELSEKGKNMPKYTDAIVKKNIDIDAENIRRALNE